jgi:NAD(P)H dehydrogenase (quinone)
VAGEIERNIPEARREPGGHLQELVEACRSRRLSFDYVMDNAIPIPGDRQEEAVFDITRVVVIWHSTNGNVCRLAMAALAGAWDAGGQVRLRRAGRAAPPRSSRSSPRPAEPHRESEEVVEAHRDDLLWADVVLIGAPAREEGITAPIAELIAAASVPSTVARLAGKVYGAFTAAEDGHVGADGTPRALADVFVGWGGILVPPGITDPTRFWIAGAPDVAAAAEADTRSRAELAAARRLGDAVPP